MTIIRNSAKCKHCGTEIESKYRHDYVVHTCKAPDGHEVYIAVDGGTAYLRRSANLWEDMEETSIEAPSPEELR